MMRARIVFGAAMAATLFGSLAASMITATQGHPDDSPLTVPVGRIGDRVVYAFEVSQSPTEEVHHVERLSAPSPMGGYGQRDALANERTKALYALIHGEPGIVTQDLAARAGVGLPTAAWHLQRLEEAGLVGRVKRGRSVHFYANEGRPPASPDPREAPEVA